MDHHFLERTRTILGVRMPSATRPGSGTRGRDTRARRSLSSRWVLARTDRAESDKVTRRADGTRQFERGPMGTRSTEATFKVIGSGIDGRRPTKMIRATGYVRSKGTET